jgi:ribose/xylose/arabinose/galactoside ABC-type transport system permease subunit
MLSGKGEAKMNSHIIQFLLKKRALVILFVLFLIACLSTKEFLTLGNINNVLLQVATDGIIAIGMTIVILIGGIDLSVGSVVAMASVITIWMQPQFGSGVGILVSILASAAIGLINGLLITQVGVSPFVTTLGVMTFVKGIALAISNSRTQSGIDPVFAGLANIPVLGIPLGTCIFILMVIATNLYLVRNHTGRGLYAVGGNPEASWLAGLNVKGYTIASYVFCSITAAIGGILLTSRINTGSPIIGGDTSTIVISAVLLGGTSMAGGSGTVSGTLVGVLILGVLKNMMNLIGIGGYYQTIILGTLLVITVLADRSHFKRNLHQ